MKTKSILLLLTLCFSWPLFSQSTLLGDANNSGTIDIVDALIVAQYYVGTGPAVINLAASDVDNDGSVGIVDALLIAQYYVGIITQFPGQAQSVEVLKSNEPRNTSPSTGDIAELVAGNTAFAIDIYKKACTGVDNVILSPYSMSVAFGMLYAGARTTTDTEIANTFNFTLGQSRLHEAFNALDLELAKPGNPQSGTTGDQLTLRLANSIWGQRNYHFLQSFLDTLSINYGAGLNALDFASNPDGSRITINEWVSDQTEDKINDLLPPGVISTDTRLVLTNAIYFRASWENKFNPSNTNTQTFTLLDNTTLGVQMMHQTSKQNAAEVAGEYQALSLLYYGSKFSMVIIVPDMGSYDSFESSLDPGRLSAILGSLAQRTVTLSMPKWNYEWQASIKTMLQSLGMTVPFLPAADFSGITTVEPLLVKDAIHKAYIGVNEEGTEAAAATAIITAPSAPPPITITLDRPFVYIIRENTTNTILFIGRVTRP